MDPLDDYTLETEWNRWDPEADTVDIRIMWPMPRHILEEVSAADKQRFTNTRSGTPGSWDWGPISWRSSSPGATCT